MESRDLWQPTDCWTNPAPWRALPDYAALHPGYNIAE